MYQVYLDVEFTRRKRLFHVMDCHDTCLYSGPTMSGVIRFLHDAGQTEFMMWPNEHSEPYLTKLARV